jgi:hypothetical protein
MALLPRFSTPARLPDGEPENWSEMVHSVFASFVGAFPQFYDPTETDTPAEATVIPVVWPAFPGSLRGSAKERLENADAERGAQDEYCEWAVERRNGKITRVTFTTEVPEFFDHLFATDRNGLLALYHQLIGPQVQPDDLEQNGVYLRENKWNTSTEGRPAHLVQGTNNLGAAIRLAAEATILRERNGNSVTGKQELVDCGGLGEPLRNSDPQIASDVNNAAASGAEITLNDPIGLYIDGLITGGMETPDQEDPAAFWRIERGDAEHILRASYEVPDEQAHERGYTVGDIKIDGRPIDFGGQLAIRVRVRVDAVVKTGTHSPGRKPCVNLI